jgi:hypothetical protein
MPRVSKTEIVRRYLWAGHRCDYETAFKRWRISQRTYQLIVAQLRKEFPIRSEVRIVTRKRSGKPYRLRIAIHERLGPRAYPATTRPEATA